MDIPGKMSWEEMEEREGEGDLSSQCDLGATCGRAAENKRRETDRIDEKKKTWVENSFLENLVVTCDVR